LTYVFGSQQEAHQDTIHLTPFPAGYMCGTWIALQDVVPDSGELIVYPGNHRENACVSPKRDAQRWRVTGPSSAGLC
jgi:ectoine hydroxylase-related dioxygenase (phytanoyl-CoA dioxygenase family)